MHAMVTHFKIFRYGHGRGTEHGGFSQYSIVKEKYCYKLQHDTSPLQVEFKFKIIGNRLLSCCGLKSIPKKQKILSN